MKEITINNRKYYYETYSNYDTITTRIYKKSKKQRKRFFIFGKLVDVYDFAFSINGHIENMLKEKQDLLNNLESYWYQNSYN